jgi:hypothetical protein
MNDERTETRRHAVTHAAAALIAAVVVSAASAAFAQATGTISCSLVGAHTDQGHGIAFRPFIGSDPRSVRVRATNTDSACDDSGVSGAKRPMQAVAAKFIGKMLDTTCANFTSAPQFTAKASVKVRWQYVGAYGRRHTSGASKALLASAAFDGGSNALVLTTAPISRGDFLGETMTLHLGIDTDAASFNSECVNADIVGLSFGQLNPSSIDVQ